MIVMPLQIGRPRSLSPQPHHRNEYQHSPHPPNHPMKPNHPIKPHQHRGSNRGPEVCGKAVGTFVGGMSPSHHRTRPSEGTSRLHSHEDSVLEVAAVQNRQLAMRLGEIDRESQRLLKTRQRELAEVRRIKKDIQKHTVYEGSAKNGKTNSRKSDKLSDVLSHTPINLNLPRVPSKPNSPNHSPAQTRKTRTGKKTDEKSNASKQIKVVVKDYSQDMKAFTEPQRTSSDSDLRENNKLLSPGPRKRSMSATSIFPKTFTSSEFSLPETTSRSATSSPQHTPTIHIEQCFDDPMFHSRGADHGDGLFEPYEQADSPVSPVADDDLGTRRGKPFWELGLSPAHRARSPAEIRKAQGTCFSPTTYCKQHHPHHSFEESTLRNAKSEGNIDAIPSKSSPRTSDPRFQHVSSFLVGNDRAKSSDDVSESETTETRSSSQASSPSSSFLQLPSLKLSEGPYEENLSGLRRFSETTEPRPPTPERRVSTPSSPSQIPNLPVVNSPRPPLSSPSLSPRSSRAKMRHVTSGSEKGKHEIGNTCTFLAPGQNDITSPPVSPVPPLVD